MTTCRYNHEKKHSKSYKTCNFTHHFLSNFLLVFNDEFALRFCYIYWNYSEGSFGVSWKSSFIGKYTFHTLSFSWKRWNKNSWKHWLFFVISKPNRHRRRYKGKEKLTTSMNGKKRRLWISHLFTSGRLGFWIEFW